MKLDKGVSNGRMLVK